MSIEAITWAMQQAPAVPAVKGRPAPSSCRSVLVGLAYHAGKSGNHAFPSVATLVTYTDLSERTVRACLDRLVEVGLIRRCAPSVVAAYIPRADRRPDGYDLALGQCRSTDSGVQPVHPVEPDSEPNEVQPSHPVDANGVQSMQNGVQSMQNGVQCVQERGAAVAPEPSMNRPGTQKQQQPRASERERDRRSTTTHDELAASAVKPHARQIVDAWRNSRPDVTGYRPQVIRELSRVVDGLLRDRADPELVRAVLDEWDQRADVHKPGALTWLYDDAAKASRATRSGRPEQHTAAQPAMSTGDRRIAELQALKASLPPDEPPTPLRAIEGGRTA